MHLSETNIMYKITSVMGGLSCPIPCATKARVSVKRISSRRCYYTRTKLEATLNRDATTSELRLVTLNRDVTTPELGLVTPNRDATTPELGLVTLNRDATTPELGLVTPGRDATTPELGLVTPNRDATTPELGLVTPNRDATTPELGLVISNRDATTPELGHVTPGREDTAVVAEPYIMSDKSMRRRRPISDIRKPSYTRHVQDYPNFPVEKNKSKDKRSWRGIGKSKDVSRTKAHLRLVSTPRRRGVDSYLGWEGHRCGWPMLLDTKVVIGSRVIPVDISTLGQLTANASIGCYLNRGARRVSSDRGRGWLGHPPGRMSLSTPEVADTMPNGHSASTQLFANKELSCYRNSSVLKIQRIIAVLEMRASNLKK
ncbi:hypothetical protein J6590_030502 [Homalodisca vitripennis]|nr:hypothetical protein J6590_030502 [Homalodisca vitripennis]